ncbi:hypothetical protein, partial [Stenotrophomonas indicatrix]|uniref:hypothetical protein n=1 Tax=Stenotrophomonas indicatrix TaxID=2045451 RepID=UPI0028AFE876
AGRWPAALRTTTLPASGRHYPRGYTARQDMAQHKRRASSADDAPVHHPRYLLAEHRHILI